MHSAFVASDPVSQDSQTCTPGTCGYTARSISSALNSVVAINSESSDPLLEYQLGEFIASEWHEGLTIPMKAADLWARHIPRGKGWFPRWVGKNLCANHRVHTRTLHGAKLAVAPSSLDVYTSIATMGNSWDEHVVDACKSVLSDRGVFYDIGANVGYISVELAAALMPDGSVIAFEPQPALAKNIAISARLNGFANLRVSQLMLGDHTGSETLHVGSHSIHASAIAREANSSRLPCRMTTLDSVVESGAIPPPTVMKIDVEGAELAVISGAARTIQKHRPYIIFESDVNMDRYGYTRKDILDLLSSFCSYEYFFVTWRKSRIPLTDENLDSREYGDLMAVPAG